MIPQVAPVSTKKEAWASFYNKFPFFNFDRLNSIYKALSPTSEYTALDKNVIVPKIDATKSKFKNPTNPQFNPPTIIRTMANQFNIFIRF